MKANDAGFIRIINRFSHRIRRRGVRDTLEAAWNIGTGLADYHLNPFALKTSRLPPRDWLQIRREMERVGLQVVSYWIDVPKFRAWLQAAAFPEYYARTCGDVFIEKALEHYVAADLLDLAPGQVFVDVAASSSPWMNIASRLYDVKGIALDLSAPISPVEGDKLAADATHMPFPDGSVDKMALHCAYEMFEGDADSRLFDSDCVLRRGGRIVILPLYMHHLYYADSSPLIDRRGVDYQGAKRVWREGRGTVRFSRKYDVPALVERVVQRKGSLHLRIYYVENETQVDPVCYLKFAAVFERAA